MIFKKLLLAIGILGIFTQISHAAGHSFGLYAVGPHMRAAKMANASSIRYILNWDQFEPTEGHFDYTAADKIVSQAGQENIDLVFTIQCNSKWACNNSNKSSAPIKMSNWQKLCSNIVERYDGDGKNDMPSLKKPVKYWQIQNEWQSEWNGTNKEFIELIQVAYQTIKAADQKATIISSGLIGTRLFALAEGFNENGWIYWGVNDKQISQAGKLDKSKANSILKQQAKIYDQAQHLLAKGNKYFDLIDIHLYAVDPYECLYDLKWLKHEMQKLKVSKPIWSLEFACPFYEFSDTNFVRAIVKAQVLGFYGGLERIYWSSLTPITGLSENFLRLSLASSSGVPGKAFLIYSTMANAIASFTEINKVPNKDPNIWLFQFSSPKQKNLSKEVWIGWAKKDNVQVSINCTSAVYVTKLKAPFEPSLIEKRTASPKGQAVNLGLDPILIITTQ